MVTYKTYILWLLIYAGYITASLSLSEAQQQLRIYLQDDTSYVRTESTYGIKGVYPSTMSAYFYNQLAGSLQAAGALSASPRTADVECSVRLVEVNEAHAGGLISWIFKRAWAVSEVSCTGNGKQLRREINAKTSRAFLEDNALTGIIWHSDTAPVNSPMFANTPAGMTLNSLISLTRDNIVEMASTLMK